ncbi:tyrosine-protein phosphatase non-receptor type substrate 1-like [Erpetoichthys calabaricus]|uniref:tyrosine-protein phosphatase non-receptor type substrate 1-like n=1 Tax=Erpetoichthys calabaricus TaxID=27687 RepID=UPI002233EB5C|nr:tyrosine-protein phosphatase non-receptor type substrate 1-like [Erpetoichthys calabaricus]
MLLLLALTVAAPSRAQRQVSDIEFLSLPHQTTTIYGVLGDNITLSCSFRRHGEWFRAYWYENDTVNREVKPICSITDSDRNSSTCTLSFSLHNISLAQSGRSYKCVVENVEEQPPKLWTDQSQTFYVRAAPSRPTISSQGGQVMGYKLNISCLVHRFYPSNISMTWLLNHQPMIATGLEDVTMNADGTFTAVSHLSFLLAAEHLSGTVTCQVSHEALQQPLKTDFLLDVKYGPRLIRILHRTSSEANFQEIPSSPMRVIANSYFELRCTADSNPNSSIYWTSAREQGRIDQAHGRELSWTHIQEAQSNDYWCLAENAHGNASKSVTVVVLQPDGLSPLKLLTVVIVVVTLFLILLAIFFYVINNRKQTGE